MDPLDTVVAGLSCRDVLLQLNDFLDGDLPAADVQRVTSHLAGCRRCERFGGRVGAVIAALRETVASDHAMPSGVAGRLRTRLANERR